MRSGTMDMETSGNSRLTAKFDLARHFSSGWCRWGIRLFDYDWDNCLHLRYTPAFGLREVEQ